MDWQTLDEEIKLFQSLVGHACSTMWDKDSAWARAWKKCNDVQAGFSDGVWYPSKQARERAWVKFNAIRSEGRPHHEQHRRRKSEHLYGEILSLLKRAHHDAVSELFDSIVFAFDPTTKEDMIHKGKLLNEARKYLTEHKGEMLFEHKDDCHTRIVKIQKWHDHWWGKFKERGETRRAEAAERKAKWESDRAAFKQRVRRNIENNQERLEKSQAALSSMKRSAEDLEEKIEAAWNDDWKSKAEEWLEELNGKIHNTEEHIERLETWIAEDKRKESES